MIFFVVIQIVFNSEAEDLEVSVSIGMSLDKDRPSYLRVKSDPQSPYHPPPVPAHSASPSNLNPDRPESVPDLPEHMQQPFVMPPNPGTPTSGPYATHVPALIPSWDEQHPPAATMQIQEQQQQLAQDIFNQGQPQTYATCWIAAEHALQHIERYCPQIETTFEHYDIRGSQYAVYAGFDESCIRRGSGYLEQIHIFTLSTILATSSLLTDLGKILSLFSSILFTESSRFSLPVYKDDGTTWEFDELVFEMASKYLDHGLTAAMYPTVISLSQTMNNKADESQQDSEDGSGDNGEKKDSGGSEAKGKGRNRGDGNGRKNPGGPSRDGNCGSGYPGNSGDRDIDGSPDDPDPDPEGETKETTHSPNIAFEVSLS